MAIFSFGQKNDQNNGQDAEAEKKIEFARKLPVSDVEGEEAGKGGNFDFFKNLEPRKPGEKAAVKMADEATPQDRNTPPIESVTKKKSNLISRLADFFKSGARTAIDKNPSRVLEVNLVKGEIVKYFDWQRGILVLLIAVFITLAVLSGIYWGISWWGSNNQNAQGSNYLQQYYKISKQIKDLSPQVNEVLVFKTKLDQVNFLLERHIYWTNFFSFLEDNTLSNVYFSSFSGTVNGTYGLSATTNSLDAIDAQIKKLLVNPYIEKAEVNSGTVGGESGKPVITFNLSFAIDPKIFLK
ncbi:MAG: hypothetical protein PHO56_00850 [Patescibacteria group bacterium]|nr:hypothetical protein [Patescibacteria group bacterium]